MWFVFGFFAIITAILHLLWFMKNKECKWFRFISLSFTILTVCAFYSDVSSRVLSEDWSSLIDIVPTMTKMLWLLSGISIFINSISLFKKSKS